MPSRLLCFGICYLLFILLFLMCQILGPKLRLGELGRHVTPYEGLETGPLGLGTIGLGLGLGKFH